MDISNIHICMCMYVRVSLHTITVVRLLIIIHVSCQPASFYRFRFLHAPECAIYSDKRLLCCIMSNQ